MANFMSYTNAEEIFQQVLSYIDSHSGSGTVKTASVNGSTINPTSDGDLAFPALAHSITLNGTSHEVDSNGIVDLGSVLGSVTSAILNGDTIEPSSTGVLSFPNLLHILNIDGTSYTVDSSGTITLTNVIPSTFVKTVSVNGGTHVEPDADKNVNLEIDTYTLELKGGSSGIVPYNCVISNATSGSVYSSLIRFKVSTDALFELWAVSRHGYVKIGRVTGKYRKIDGNGGGFYIGSTDTDYIYMPYNGSNNKWFLKVTYGTITVTDTDGTEHNITQTTNNGSTPIVVEGTTAPSRFSYINASFIYDNSYALTWMGNYSCRLTTASGQSIADNVYTVISINTTSDTNVTIPTPSCEEVANLERYIYIENPQSSAVTVNFVNSNGNSIRSVSVQANSNMTIEIDFQKIPGVKYWNN